MRIDLLHNKIIRETITDRFSDSIKENLLPKLSYVYGEELQGILMYEDYIADNLKCGTDWYYPLTLLLSDTDKTLWIKWSMEDKRSFKDGVPYAYVGEDVLEFTLAEDVPAELLSVLDGRAVNYDSSALTLKVHYVGSTPTFLCGKYSQTFIDEMSSQITAEIARALSVEGLDKSTLELQLVFASGTYMEHTSENVTYRRLLLTERGCQARDFWVKWTRLDSALGYSISDNVSADSIKFELGEDVPQKIREKEYRFLCSTNPDKYQSAMGKKTVTEWRDLIKRAIKRGDLVRVESEPEIAAHAEEVSDKLREILGSYGMTPAVTENTDYAEDSYDSTLAAMARAALGVTDEESEAEDAAEEQAEFAYATVGADEQDAEYAAEAEEYSELDEDTEEREPIDLFADVEAESDEFDTLPDVSQTDALEYADFDDEPYLEMTSADEEESYTEEVIEEEAVSESESATEESSENEFINSLAKEELDKLREARIRAEIEAKVRLEYEAQARVKAEAEAAALRMERERLRRENERLMEQARLAEEQRQREEAARRAEEQRQREAAEQRKREEEQLRARMAEQARLEEEERRRLAETARIAVEEQRRLEAEKAERLERERQEILRIERERLAREEEARRADERRREEERRRIAEMQRAAQNPPKPEVQYVTKHAKLIFGKNIDPNVINRIKEIVEDTLVVYGKQDVHLHIKAYPLDSYTINLDIMKIPSNETDLLVSIIKAIGNGRIGITKIIVE